jgi:hypothetical protein
MIKPSAVVLLLCVAPSARALELTSLTATAGQQAGTYDINADMVMDVPTAAVRKVVSHLCDYRESFKYLLHCQTFKLVGNVAWSYSMVDGTFVRPRDYVIATEVVEDLQQDGTGRFRSEWWLDNPEGPPLREGIVRVAVNHGSWLMEPVDNGKKTHLHYTMTCAPGGRVPAWAAAFVLKETVPEYLNTLEKLSQAESRTLKPGAPAEDLWASMHVLPLAHAALPKPQPKGTWVLPIMTF